jgi:NAD(P)-dependent dehydrogenase (short-subunit alcohol dehydrogenase family)
MESRELFASVMFNSQNKPHALITGGSSGIGWAAGRCLAKHGWIITIVDRQKPRTSRLDSRLVFKLADVSDCNVFASIIDQLRSKLDALILCAAEPPFLPDLQRMLRTNGCAPIQNVLTCRGVLRREASVVLVGSTGAYRVQFTTPWRNLLATVLRGEKHPRLPSSAARLDSELAYRLAKRLIIESVRPVAKLLAPQRIRVNCVIPGPTLTPMTGPLRYTSPTLWRKLVAEAPFVRPNTASEVGNTIGFLCSKSARNLTGSLFHLDGGWYVENKT